MKNLIFTQLTEQLPYPPQVKGKLSSLHSSVIAAAVDKFQDTRSFKTDVIDVLNCLSYCILTNMAVHTVWSINDPLILTNCDALLDSPELLPTLGELFISYSDVSWDVEEPEVPVTIGNVNQALQEFESAQREANFSISNDSGLTDALFAKPEIVDLNSRREEQLAAEEANQPTPKFHLLLGHSPFPQFDYSSIWFHQIINSTEYTMYRTLPEIPTNQSEITITTDPGKLTAKDRAKLFPNRVIHVRPQEMHIPVTGLPFDETLGTIIPISGFSEELVRRNIIEYPHFHMLMKHADAPDSENFGIRSFGASIEIDGELLDLTQEESWEQVPDLNKLPRTAKFRNEYVIRRYLLERDIIGIKHKYPMYGALQKFLTLFMPAEQYLALGYDPDKIAEQCVKSRVNFYLTRNPILRMAYGDKVFQLMR